MSFSMAPFLFQTSISVTLAVLLVIPLDLPVANAGTGYDISINDLNTVKKKAASKKVTKIFRKKKRAAEPEVLPKKTIVSVEQIDKTINPIVESNSSGKVETVYPKYPVEVESLTEPENTRILHSPYSFVTTAKRTVIHAVIDSKVDIKEVICTLRDAGEGIKSQVKMVKVNGTRFTYAADLPALNQASFALRYTIEVIDLQDKVTRSKEYITPVKQSPFVPSWQIEGVDERIPVKQIKQE